MPLPYPDLVFVPLDILTAEEQNEIVANYTYIYGLFPVAASNIDYTSVPKVLAGKTARQNVGYGSTVFTVTLPETLRGTDYTVVASLTSSASAGWGSVNFTKWKCSALTTSSFKIEVWNDEQTTVNNVAFNWIVVEMPSA